MSHSATRLTDLAIRLLRQSLPLPVDLTTRLIGMGVDVSELERRYAA